MVEEVMARTKVDDTPNAYAVIGRAFQVLTVFYMLLIFYLSHQPSLPQPEAFEEVPAFDKFEHMFEYFILGGLMFLSLRYAGTERYRRMAWMYAITGAIVYAFTDEVHQFFVSERVLDMIDLLADCTGILIAVFLGAAYSERARYQAAAPVPLSKGMLDSEE
jgi:VanZ family protein